MANTNLDETQQLLDNEVDNDPQTKKRMCKQYLDKGRQILRNNQYLLASKQFSKCVLTVQHLLQNGLLSTQESRQLPTQILLPAYSNLSLCYLKMQNYPSVIQLTSEMLAMDINNIKARYRRAFAYQLGHQYEEALDDINILMKLSEEMKNSKELNQLKRKCYERIKTRKQKQRKAAQSWITKDGGLNYPERENKSHQKLKQILDQIEREGQKSYVNRICKCLYQTWSKVIGKQMKQQ